MTMHSWPWTSLMEFLHNFCPIVSALPISNNSLGPDTQFWCYWPSHTLADVGSTNFSLEVPSALFALVCGVGVSSLGIV